MFKKYNKEDEILVYCNDQTILYFIWLGLNFLSVILKIVSVNFSYRSHIYIKKQMRGKKKKNI